MEDNEWLKTLKVGDKVFVRHGYDSKNMSIRTVKKITPKKNIRLNNDLLFKNGECKQSVWSSDYLIKYSDEKMDEIYDMRAHHARRQKLMNVKWQNISDELIDAVYDRVYEAGIFDE